jgi:hypothetical protein
MELLLLGYLIVSNTLRHMFHYYYFSIPLKVPRLLRHNINECTDRFSWSLSAEGLHHAKRTTLPNKLCSSPPRQTHTPCLAHTVHLRVIFWIIYRGAIGEKRLMSTAPCLQVCSICKTRDQKGKAIPVTGREDPQGYETSRLPHFLDNRLTDCGEVVSPTRRPPFTPQEDSWYSFLLEAESTPGP